MKTNIILLVLLTISICINGQIYTGPIPQPTSGYGADGSYSVASESFINPNFPTENIKIYYPSGIVSKVPTIFYSHGFGGNNPSNIMGLLKFVAQKGYAIVFVPYQTTGVTVPERYSNLLNGFIKAARDYPNIIDTTKLGFMGHSFGGGATFANSYYCFTHLKWGESGRFIFASAPYYSFNITQTEVQTFPADVKLLTMVYDNDSTNDHRMAIDIFKNINIPASEKDYLLVKSDTISGYVYEAIHGVPNTLSAFDALDYYAIYRHLDALCDYTFNGSLAGKDVALGNGSANQIFMPIGMKNLEQSDSPYPKYPENIYTYTCSDISNPRQAYCEGTSSVAQTENETIADIFPNPAQSTFTISCKDQNFSFALYDYSGRKIRSENSVYQDITVNTENFSNGIYFVRITLKNGKQWTEKLMINNASFKK
jgi:pimeloyl-ACP methyl ester carboxylesterase